MSNIFEVIDPLGRSIYCTEERWEGHILPARNWPSNSRWDVHVIRALTDPTFICKDNLFDDRICYYRRPGKTTAYMKVVVDLIDPLKIGEVVTAYETDSGKKGETLIWPTSSS